MGYSEPPTTIEEVRRLAQRVVDRQTKQMVADALALARWILAHTNETLPALPPDSQ